MMSQEEGPSALSALQRSRATPAGLPGTSPATEGGEGGRGGRGGGGMTRLRVSLWSAGARRPRVNCGPWVFSWLSWPCHDAERTGAAQPRPDPRRPTPHVPPKPAGAFGLPRRVPPGRTSDAPLRQSFGADGELSAMTEDQVRPPLLPGPEVRLPPGAADHPATARELRDDRGGSRLCRSGRAARDGGGLTADSGH